MQDIQAIQAQTPTEFFDRLVLIRPEFFSQWTAVDPSLSLQGGPRLLMTEGPHQMIIGTTSCRGENRVEIERLDLSQAKPRWVFLERDFGAGETQFSDRTAECALCHSPDPRLPELAQPLWDTYKDWPRVLFGSDHPSPYSGFSRQAFEKFRSEAATHPIYRHLKFNIDDQDPYRNTQKQWQQNHNSHIDEATQDWNIFRLDQEIRSNPLYSKLKFALWVAIGHSTAEVTEDPRPGTPDFVVRALGGPDAVLGQVYLQRYSRLLEEYRKRIRHAVYSNLSINNYQGFSNSTSQNEIIFQLDEAMAGLESEEIENAAHRAAELGGLLDIMGIDLTQFSTHTARRAPLFGAHVRFKELSVLLADREQIVAFDWDRGWVGFESWIARSRTESANVVPLLSPVPRALEPHELFIQRCASCHSGEDRRISFIPFSNQADFKNWISPARSLEIMERLVTHDISERMPYQYPALHPDEIETIKSYFQNLLSLENVPGLNACSVDPFRDLLQILQNQSETSSSLP